MKRVPDVGSHRRLKTDRKFNAPSHFYENSVTDSLTTCKMVASEVRCSGEEKTLVSEERGCPATMKDVAQKARLYGEPCPAY